MPIQIIRNDITKMQVDAIVNTANRELGLSGGVNGMIHTAAGPELLAACQKLGGCQVGEVKITKGYQLPCRYIIHTVGPVWNGGDHGEEDLLRMCYLKSLKLALNNGCESIAFPLISTGAFGYPQEKALRVAMETISTFLLNHEDVDMMVYLLVFNKESVQVGSKLFYHIEQFIDDHYVDVHSDERRRRARYRAELAECQIMNCDEVAGGALADAPLAAPEKQSMEVFQRKAAAAPKPFSQKNLDLILDVLDESFSQMVVRKIQEKGMKNSDCYKKANIDKKLFSKIYNDPHYKPKKQTAVALAIALELDIDEAKELLMKAGYALSHSDKFDLIIEYFIVHKRYNIFEINEMLFCYDQTLLGSTMN